MDVKSNQIFIIDFYNYMRDTISCKIHESLD